MKVFQENTFQLKMPVVQEMQSLNARDVDVRLHMLRLDLLDPELSGNKWFKLKLNLQAARARGAHTLVSFGGVWSNHLHALASAGKRFGLQTVGVLRGRLPVDLNPCLQDLQRLGMRLIPLSREDYRRRNDPVFVQYLLDRYCSEPERCHVIPEGGCNRAGVLGCADILQGVEQEYDCIALACGTGTTLAGLATAGETPLLGVQVLRGEGYLQQQVQDILRQYGLSARGQWQVMDQYHRGGYARTDSSLLAYCMHFEALNGIPLEPVYSGKLMMALEELIGQGFFPEGSKVLAIHGGGLQGKRGFNNEISIL